MWQGLLACFDDSLRAEINGICLNAANRSGRRDRFFRSLIGNYSWADRKVRLIYSDGKINAKRGPQHGSEFREMVMKNRFIALGFEVLLAALGFALELGITATLLRLQATGGSVRDKSISQWVCAV